MMLLPARDDIFEPMAFALRVKGLGTRLGVQHQIVRDSIVVQIQGVG